MYICPICDRPFTSEKGIVKHSLRCWREHNPNHQPKPAPCKGNITKEEMNEDTANFFASFQKGELCQQ